MKRISLVLIILFFLTQPALSQPPFKFECLTTYLLGLSFTENSVIAFGTNGVLLRSSDKGDKWTQISAIDDNYNIIRVKSKNNKYYGVLNKEYAITSMDEGISWSKHKLADDIAFLDMDIDDEYLYFLSIDNIYVFDFDFNEISRIAIYADDNATEIRHFSGRLYSPADSGRVIVFDIKDNFKRTVIDFKEMNLCELCSKPRQIIEDNGILYIVLSNDLLKSDDGGASWSLLAKNSINMVYNVFDGEIFQIRQTVNQMLRLAYFEYHRIGEFGSERISAVETSPRYVQSHIYFDFALIGDNTVIAVGVDKLINVSRDGGVNWELKSNLKLEPLGFFPKIINDDTAYAFQGYGQVFRTTNAGATWTRRGFPPVHCKAITRFALTIMGTARFFQYALLRTISILCSPTIMGKPSLVFQRTK